MLTTAALAQRDADESDESTSRRQKELYYHNLHYAFAPPGVRTRVGVQSFADFLNHVVQRCLQAEGLEAWDPLDL